MFNANFLFSPYITHLISVPAFLGLSSARETSYLTGFVLNEPPRPPHEVTRYLLPRPLRLTFLGGGVVSCFVASVVSASQVSQQIWLHLEPDFSTLLINLGGLAAFALVFVADQQAASKRMDRRKQVALIWVLQSGCFNLGALIWVLTKLKAGLWLCSVSNIPCIACMLF